MEVNFAPETEKKLKDLAAQSGRKTAGELVQDVIEGYFEELAKTRSMLDSRYDELKSGRVKAIPGDEVEAYFRDKSAAARRSQQGSRSGTPSIRRRVLTSKRFGNSFVRITWMQPTV
jgi:predicted DNA-binding protein